MHLGSNAPPTCRALLIVLRKLFKGIAANQSTGISLSASPVSLLYSVVASSIAWQRAFGIPSIGNSTAVHVFVGGFLLLIKCMQVILEMSAVFGKHRSY